MTFSRRYVRVFQFASFSAYNLMVFFCPAIVGGLILLVNMGPGASTHRSFSFFNKLFNILNVTGGLSVDEKKKNF